MSIERAAVVGSGVMGSGIAAHLANAGVPVLLLDVVPEGANNRNQLAEAALARMAKQDPAPFMTKRAMSLVTPGNLEDDLDTLGGVDWIVEAVVERLDVKRGLYARLARVRKPGAVVSSNTSTLPLKALTEGMDEALKRDFVITHFFNPARYMRLLEVVAGPATDPGQLVRIKDFADRRLGKTVIEANDTPGFIANRIGTFWMQAALKEAIDTGLPIEEADAVLGRPFGIPKTGVFGLADLVGIDLLPYVAKSLHDALPPDDPYQEEYRDEPFVRKLIEAGYTGRKGKGGFYRLNTEHGSRVKESISLQTGDYAPSNAPGLPILEVARTTGPAAFFADDHPASRFAASVMGKTLAYAAALVPEIASDVAAVDDAMRCGYNFKQGPFELIDRIGPKRLAAWLEAKGRPVPDLLRAVGDGTFYRVEGGRLEHFGTDGVYHEVVRPDGVLLLSDVKRRSEPLAKNGSAKLWDIGDGVLCLEFTSKMNALDEGSIEMVGRALKLVPKAHKALVVHNEGTNFSVGANLGLALFAANVAAWPMIEQSVEGGQRAYRAMKHAPFPVVAAPSGMALGGGCEICLHADAVQAHAETYMGLVEVGVGVVPGWGGCTEMLTRWLDDKRRPQGPMPAVSQAFETIGTAKVAKSAHEARELRYLREADGVTMNRDRLLFDAKAKALALAEGYAPPARHDDIRLPGPAAKAALALAVEGLRLQGKATPHDAVVADALADVLSGAATDITEPLTEDDLLKLERRAFMRLVKTPGTLARIEHMLATGKPLRN